MKACIVEGCNTRGDRQGGYCTAHMREHVPTAALPWHTSAASKFQIGAARIGTNTSCVDCGGTPLDGGLRCGPCFTRCTLARREATARLRSERDRKRQLRVVERSAA